MKNRWLLGIAVLVISILGCGIFSLVSVNPVRIDSVSVTPSNGNGTFTLHVLFRLKDDITDGEMVHCTYVTPDGGTTTIGDFIPEPYDSSHDVVFTATQPGLYSAGCQSVSSGSSQTTTFTVTGNATPTPTADVIPVPTATLPVVMPRGQIIFDYANAQSTRGPGWGGLLLDATKGCIPDVSIDPDGAISGRCEFSGQMHLIPGTIVAIVTGQVGTGQGSNFTFTYEVTSKGPNGWDLKPGETPSVRVWSNESIWQIKYTSTTGSFTSADEASGTADFVYTCDSGAENLIWCYQATSESFTGTLPWSFVPSP